VSKPFRIFAALDGLTWTCRTYLSSSTTNCARVVYNLGALQHMIVLRYSKARLTACSAKLRAQVIAGDTAFRT